MKANGHDETIPRHLIHDLYFDRDGLALQPEEFYERYPEGRELCARDSVCGVHVSTEFVGINHNPDPLGQPWLFETITHVDGDIVACRWTVSEPDARRVHGACVWRLRFGLWAVCRLIAVGRRARYMLHAYRHGDRP